MSMANEMELFCFKGNDVRVTKMDREPWFVAKDVCDALELGNARDAVSTLDEDEKDGVGIPDAMGRTQLTTVISLPGLFRLVSKSRVPMAKEFQRWVYHEVLPAIYYTGRYRAETADDDEASSPVSPDFKTAKYLIDGVTAFRDVMTTPMRKRIMRRYYSLIGMDGAEEFQPGDDKYYSFGLNGEIERFVEERCVRGCFRAVFASGVLRRFPRLA
ncbi:MAG: Bro-N domain-containing protein [bacterium]|nr:Bro-N domain-containing protein [bacterium]